MSTVLHSAAFMKDIQHNCDISDARDHGIYSMCTMVLKLRNLYKWEKGIEPWDEPEPADLLDWIEAKENYWESIADESYRPFLANGKEISPDDLEDINKTFKGNSLYYGAGYGRSMKAVFFLAEKVEERIVEECPVVILGRERAREMASPFAMVQDGVIIIRKEALRYFFWDQIQEVRSSCRLSFQHALHPYGLYTDGKLDQELFKLKLDVIVDEQLDFFIYHEVGEILQEAFTSRTLQKIIARFPGSAVEFVCRTIKDVLADTHPKGLLAYIIREKRESSLGLYIGFLDGLREKLFPEILESWKQFLEDKNWHSIENARKTSWENNQRCAVKIHALSQLIGQIPDEQLIDRFNKDVLEPLGIERPSAN